MQWTEIQIIKKYFKMSQLVFYIYLVTFTVKKAKALRQLMIYRDDPKQLVSSLEYFSAWILSSHCHCNGSELMSKGSRLPRQIPLKSLTHCASSDSMSAYAHTIRAYPFKWHTLFLHLSMHLSFMYQCSIYKLGQYCYFILQMRNRQTYRK